VDSPAGDPCFGCWEPATTGTTVQQASVITAVPGSVSALAAGELIVPGEGSGGIVGAVWQR
jgi:hypothetical protein